MTVIIAREDAASGRPMVNPPASRAPKTIHGERRPNRLRVASDRAPASGWAMIVTTKATVATMARLVTLLRGVSLDTRSGMSTPMPPELMATSEVTSAEMPIAVRRSGFVSLVVDVGTSAWTSLGDGHRRLVERDRDGRGHRILLWMR